jgi:hypothetical protein
LKKSSPPIAQSCFEALYHFPFLRGTPSPFLFLKYIYIFEPPCILFFTSEEKYAKDAALRGFHASTFAYSPATGTAHSFVPCSANNGLSLLTCFSPWCSPLQFYDEKQVF